DVAPRGHVEQRGVLEDGGGQAAQARAVGAAARVVAEEPDGASRRLKEQRGRQEQRGLPGAVRTEKRDGFALGDGQRRAAQHLATASDDPHRLQFERRRRGHQVRRDRCWTAVSTAAMAMITASRISPSASAVPKLPRLTSSTAAVVSTRVSPARLPPTMIEAPTSDTTAPKPAITATSSGRRASRAISQTYCASFAPIARTCSRRAGGSAMTAAAVMATMIGVAMRACAITIAAGV